ncbi:MAG: terminase large subunit domain-containing protein [Bryobacteraceae bacterium]
MLPHSTTSSRAESARINGAKSTGPRTPEGLYRSQTASYKHGLYAVRNYMLPGESNEEFAELQAHLHAYWQPRAFYEEMLVEQLVGIVWETKRVHAAKNDYVHERRVSVARNAPQLTDDAKLNLMAENDASAAHGTMDRSNARLAHLARERDRIERGLLRLEKRSRTSGPSQMSLKINARQHPEIPSTEDAKPVDGRLSECPYIVEAGVQQARFPWAPDAGIFPAPEVPPNIVDWAGAALDLQPDSVQTQILTETNSHIMVLGPRQTGKSTAAAVRVLYEAMNHDDAVILLASASGRQSGQIMEKALKMARQIDLYILPPPPKCNGFSVANGARIVALPDNEETVRGFSAPRLIVVDEAAYASPDVFKALDPMLAVSAGTIMLLSTPNGRGGYFYERWHAENSPWTRILGTLADCPRIDADVIRTLRQTMSQRDFEQEFECKFVDDAGQFIGGEIFDRCLTDDFPLFFPEYDKEVS